MDLKCLTCQISNTNLFGIWRWTKASMYAVGSNPVIGPENKIILWIGLNQQTTPVQFPFKPFSVRWSVVSICTSFNKYTTFLKALNQYSNGRITKMIGEPGFYFLLEWGSLYTMPRMTLRVHWAFCYWVLKAVSQDTGGQVGPRSHVTKKNHKTM